ncbi:MAG: metal ABC transporter ATP-binding protein [Clostridia bacterium]|nr:metal ABC transporter ATP-binding protein [Clostridia bacterium]
MSECKFCCTEIKNIGVKTEDATILEDVSFHLHCGELAVIIGKNGAGKSTLLKSIIGEIRHTGNITFSSKHNNSKKLTIGYVPQKIDLEHSPISVYDLISSFSSSKPVFAFKSKSEYSKIIEHLKFLEADGLIDKKVSSLSGGELQKVLIAIATLPFPELLILDEPVSGIDAKGKEIFYQLIDKIKKSQDIAILMVSHDFDKVKEYADKVILLNKKMLQEGNPKEVFSGELFAKEFGIGGY